LFKLIVAFASEGARFAPYIFENAFTYTNELNHEGVRAQATSFQASKLIFNYFEISFHFCEDCRIFCEGEWQVKDNGYSIVKQQSSKTQEWEQHWQLNGHTGLVGLLDFVGHNGQINLVSHSGCISLVGINDINLIANKWQLIGLNGRFGDIGRNNIIGFVLIALSASVALLAHRPCNFAADTCQVGPFGCTGPNSFKGVSSLIGQISLVRLSGPTSISGLISHKGLVGFIGIGLTGFIDLSLASHISISGHNGLFSFSLVNHNGLFGFGLVGYNGLIGQVSQTGFNGLVGLNGHIGHIGVSSHNSLFGFGLVNHTGLIGLFSFLGLSFISLNSLIGFIGLDGLIGPVGLVLGHISLVKLLALLASLALMATLDAMALSVTLLLSALGLVAVSLGNVCIQFEIKTKLSPCYSFARESWLWGVRIVFYSFAGLDSVFGNALQNALQLFFDRIPQMNKYFVMRECEHIGVTNISSQKGISIFKFPERFLEISCRDLISFPLLTTLII
jgi:hypothetical protein